MAIDRAAALRQAEKLLRLGKLEPAIAEYERLVEDQPKDWTTANSLGDLYVRAGQTEQAVETFIRIADAFARDGFTSKAAALYKKVLKLQPEHEPTLLKTAEIAAGQGLLADARLSFNAVARLRRARGDEPGVARITIRLGSLDPLDIAARFAAVHARVAVGEARDAVADLKDLVATLIEKNRMDDARRVQHAILGIDPSDHETRATLAEAKLAAGDVDAALALLTPGGDATALQGAVASLIKNGQMDVACRLVDRWLAADASRTLDVARLGTTIAVEHQDEGYQIVLRGAAHATARREWTAAVDAVQEFLRWAPKHVPALTQLVEIAVDAGLNEPLTQAQSALADAYLEAGQASEARFILEDLLSRRPDDEQVRERLKQARIALGEPEPEEPKTEVRSAEPEPDVVPLSDVFTLADELSADLLSLPIAIPVPAPSTLASPAGQSTARVPAPPATEDAPAIDLGSLADYAKPPEPRKRPQTAEVDLSVALNDFKPPKVPTPLSGDLDGVFAQLREEAGRRPLLETAEQDLKRGQVLYQCGQLEESLIPLRSAARVPRLRFESASLLGRALRALGRTDEAVEWTERAAEAPAPTPEAGHEVLYELADALEKVGETARALAVCLELQADTGGYRDVAVRVERLTRVQARG